MKSILKHFFKIAEKYRDLRITDTAPIVYISEQIQERSTVRAADLGCGAGRYDLKLFRHIGGKLSLYCIDSSRKMLEELHAYLRQHGVQAFQAIEADATNLPLKDASLDCVFSFNAIHHFRAPQFLEETFRVLNDDGYLFIYTRLRSQNSRNIWGMFFPRFSQKESRLLELDELEALFRKAPRLTIQATEFFKYERVCSFDQLLERARYHHYSTFWLYSKSEFAAALQQFKRDIRQHYEDLENIRWFDENVLLVARKRASKFTAAA